MSEQEPDVPKRRIRKTSWAVYFVLSWILIIGGRFSSGTMEPRRNAPLPERFGQIAGEIIVAVLLTFVFYGIDYWIRKRRERRNKNG